MNRHPVFAFRLKSSPGYRPACEALEARIAPSATVAPVHEAAKVTLASAIKQVESDVASAAKQYLNLQGQIIAIENRMAVLSAGAHRFPLGRTAANLIRAFDKAESVRYTHFLPLAHAFGHTAAFTEVSKAYLGVHRLVATESTQIAFINKLVYTTVIATGKAAKPEAPAIVTRTAERAIEATKTTESSQVEDNANFLLFLIDNELLATADRILAMKSEALKSKTGEFCAFEDEVGRLIDSVTRFAAVGAAIRPFASPIEQSKFNAALKGLSSIALNAVRAVRADPGFRSMTVIPAHVPPI